MKDNAFRAGGTLLSFTLDCELQIVVIRPQTGRSKRKQISVHIVNASTTTAVLSAFIHVKGLAARLILSPSIGRDYPIIPKIALVGKLERILRIGNTLSRVVSNQLAPIFIVERNIQARQCHHIPCTIL